MSENSIQNKKSEKKRKSFTVMIVIVSILFAGGLALILYPFFTNIPSYLQKGSQLSQWESEKKNETSLEQENKIKNTADKSEAEAVSGNTLSDKTAANDSQTKNSEPEQKENYKDSEDGDLSALEGTTIYTAEDLFPLKISIPKIEVEWITNEGADVPTLRKGPGHIPQTPLPGEEGRCTISGHRTTYGAPFNRIDELEDGDLIYLEALNNKTFAYKVTDVEVVIPTFVEILIGSDKKELLLTTCYPEYSSRERMVIISELVNIYPLDYNLG